MDRLINWFETIMVTIGILAFMYFMLLSYTVLMQIWKESKPDVKEVIDILKEDEEE